MKNEARTLGIDAYVLPKVTGTRFVGHRLNAVKVLLHNWFALGRSYKKEISTRSHSDPVRSKLIGYLKELNDYRMRASAADDCVIDAENQRLGNCIVRISDNDEFVMY